MSNQEERKSFTIEELKIISEFEAGSSIRKISEEHKGFGRTKIKNILREYVKIFPEKSESIERLLLSNKTHKKVEDVDEIKDREDLSEDEIKAIYNKIRNGETLTSIAQCYGRTRDYIKRRVIEYLDDENDIQEFLDILKENQNKNGRNVYVEFLESSDGSKLTTVFNRLNVRKSKTNKKLYSFLFLTKKYARLRLYLLGERNALIENEEDRLTEIDFWKMLYDSPTLLSSSFSDKIRPALESLDNNPNVGIVNATKIIREDASILFSSISRTRLQLKILKDNNLLQAFFSKPRNFRTSPELIYALIKFGKTRDISNIFLSKKQLFERFGVETKDLIANFDVKKVYGDDEYFDKR